jgi:HSP20 family protein
MNDEINQTTETTMEMEWKPEEVPQLTVDVYKEGDVIYVVSTVAGVNPADLDISVENQTLSIKGMRKKPYAASSENLLLEECFWGEFYRELTINENLDVDGVKASLKHGVLTISIPVIVTKSQKKIEITVD